MRVSKVIFAADHAGYRLKEVLKRYVAGLGYAVEDVGTSTKDPMDYPDVVIPAAEAVAESRGRACGIVIGGSGNGEAMAANKVPGIRAAVCYDAATARLAREHNDANVLSLGARMPSGQVGRAKKIVTIFLTTPYSDAARHTRRIKKISLYEQR